MQHSQANMHIYGEIRVINKFFAAAIQQRRQKMGASRLLLRTLVAKHGVELTPDQLIAVESGEHEVSGPLEEALAKALDTDVPSLCRLATHIRRRTHQTH